MEGPAGVEWSELSGLGKPVRILNEMRRFPLTIPVLPSFIRTVQVRDRATQRHLGFGLIRQLPRR